MRQYEDAGASGATPYRDGYARLLRDVTTGMIDVVVCADLARLGRDRATLQRALTMAGAAGVSIETLDGGWMARALTSILEEPRP